MRRRIALLLAVSGGLAAASSIPAALPFAASPSTNPTGTYVAYFTGKERSSRGFRGHAISPGAWTLVLGSRAAAFYDPSRPDPPDTIRVTLRGSGNRLVFGPQAKCADQRRPAAVGIYTVARHGKTLRFTKVKDSCNDRAAVLTAHPWKKLAHADLPPGATVIAKVPVDDASGMVDTGFGSVWVANGGAGTVSRIDPATNHVIRIEVGRGIFGLRADEEDGAVWVTNQLDDSVERIDPAINAVVKRIPVGTFPIGLAVTPGAVWVANHHGPPATGSVMRIDPTTNAVVDTIPLGSLPFDGPKFIGAGAGSIWVGVPNLGGVVRISTATDAIQTTIAVKGVCTGIAADDASVWVAGWYGPGCATGVTRIDTGTNAVVGEKINAGGCVTDVAIGLGSVWYTACKSQFVGRIDPDTGAVRSLLRLDGQPTGVAIGFGSAWVLDVQHGLVLRLAPA